MSNFPHYQQLDAMDCGPSCLGKALPQTKEMLVTAEIVVKDKRLIDNLIQPVEKLLRE